MGAILKRFRVVLIRSYGLFVVYMTNGSLFLSVGSMAKQMRQGRALKENGQMISEHTS